MDTALLDAVRTALNEHPTAATLTHTWNDEAGMWFVKVSPRLASAADFSIAYDGVINSATRPPTAIAHRARTGPS